MNGQENQGTNAVENTGVLNNTGAVTQPATDVNKTEVPVTQTDEKTEVKTFTQEEVNAMLAKQKNKMPDEKELKAFKDWQEAQKTEEQRKL